MQASCFERDGVALKGYASFFREMAEEELEHAQDFMKIQSQRGGRVVLKEIPAPKKQEWATGKDGLRGLVAKFYQE